MDHRSDKVSKACIYGILDIIKRNFIHLDINPFSEREHIAICCRPSACNARAPYSGSCNFPQYFCGIWYLGHPL